MVLCPFNMFWKHLVDDWANIWVVYTFFCNISFQQKIRLTLCGLLSIHTDNPSRLFSDLLLRAFSNSQHKRTLHLPSMQINCHPAARTHSQKLPDAGVTNGTPFIEKFFFFFSLSSNSSSGKPRPVSKPKVNCRAAACSLQWGVYFNRQKESQSPSRLPVFRRVGHWRARNNVSTVFLLCRARREGGEELWKLHTPLSEKL